MRLRIILLCLLLLFGTALSLTVQPTTAQGPLLATNTPIPRAPDAGVEQYALRLWTENDLVDVLAIYIQKLVVGEPGAQTAARLLFYELQRRFPGAPVDPQQRERLLLIMLAAPRGSLDMRPVVRPYVLDGLNALRPPFDTINLVDYNGFRLEIVPANFDGDAPGDDNPRGTPDALLHVRFPAEPTRAADVLYEEYVAARLDADGSYRLLPAVPDYPAAPLGDVAALAPAGYGDFTADTLDDLPLLVNRTGTPNGTTLLVYSWRGSQMVSLTPAGETIQFGTLTDWAQGSPTLYALDYALASPAWGCISELPVSWTYSANFFRRTPVPADAARTPQDSLACRLFAAEPLFALPPAEAISLVQNLLVDFPPADPAADRAAMALIMLYALADRRLEALEQAQQLRALVDDDSRLAVQLDTFIPLAQDPVIPALEICSAVQLAVPFGACDTDAVIQRILSDRPLSREDDLLTQLDARGLPVLQTVTVTQVGRAARTAVQFALGAASWWAFAPLDRFTYAAEKLDAPPPGYEAALFPLPFLVPPAPTYQALFERDDLTGALAAMNNLQRDNPDVPFAPQGLFVQALIFDLTGDRANARQAYYALWKDHPGTLWGQLASLHLERR